MNKWMNDGASTEDPQFFRGFQNPNIPRITVRYSASHISASHAYTRTRDSPIGS